MSHDIIKFKSHDKSSHSKNDFERNSAKTLNYTYSNFFKTPLQFQKAVVRSIHFSSVFKIGTKAIIGLAIAIVFNLKVMNNFYYRNFINLLCNKLFMKIKIVHQQIIKFLNHINIMFLIYFGHG